MTRWARRERPERVQISQDRGLEEATPWSEMFRSLQNSNSGKTNPEDIEEDLDNANYTGRASWRSEDTNDVAENKTRPNKLHNERLQAEEGDDRKNNLVKRKSSNQDNDLVKSGLPEKKGKMFKNEVVIESENKDTDISNKKIKSSSQNNEFVKSGLPEKKRKKNKGEVATEDDNIPKDEDENENVVDKLALRLMTLEKARKKQEKQDVRETSKTKKKIKDSQKKMKVNDGEKEMKDPEKKKKKLKIVPGEKEMKDPEKKKKKLKIVPENEDKDLSFTIERKKKSGEKKEKNREKKKKKLQSAQVNGGDESYTDNQNEETGQDSWKESRYRVYHPYLKIAYFGGFEVLANGAKRLRNLTKAMRKKGKGEDEIQNILKLERRKEEHKLRRARNTECLCCRQMGHTVSQCPKAEGSGEFGMGICFRCGSTEHTIKKCKAKLPLGSSPYPYAQCYVCGETGHLAQACSKNTRGVYPHGGSCHRCGSITHLKGECPTIRTGHIQADEEDNDEVTLAVTGNKESVELEHEEPSTSTKKKDRPAKKPKSKAVQF